MFAVCHRNHRMKRPSYKPTGSHYRPYYIPARWSNPTKAEDPPGGTLASECSGWPLNRHISNTDCQNWLPTLAIIGEQVESEWFLFSIWLSFNPSPTLRPPFLRRLPGSAWPEPSSLRARLPHQSPLKPFSTKFYDFNEDGNCLVHSQRNGICPKRSV